MLKMKLPLKTGEERGDETAEDDSVDPQEHRHIPRAISPSSVSDRLEESPVSPSHLDKETVFEWFGLHLNPARRIEFMCGLLHMCQPLELRFLGSYLEDLARKDYHVLRDFEFRANNPSDLGVLTDAIDQVVRSKLLVCLSLLGSDSRECAGILFRILNRSDPAMFYSLLPFRGPHHPYHQACQDGSVCGRPEQTCGSSTADTATEPLEQLALLFTMASLHPAFHFHQRETIRALLDKIELAIQDRLQRQLRINDQTTELTNQNVDYLPSAAQGLGECAASHPTSPSCHSSHWTTQSAAVHIEGIMLRGISHTRMDKEYNFKVKWSDYSSTSVTKTYMELENFLLKLPKDQCNDSFEKGILGLLNQGDQFESREVEKNLRERFLSAPPVFRQTKKVCNFFNSDSTDSVKPTSCSCSCQLGNACQGNCSDASSQEEDLASYVQGHKKKHSSKSQSQSPSSAKVSQVDSWRGGHTAEVNGPAERRKSCGLRSGQEATPHADTEKRGHPVTKTKSRFLPSDRDSGKGKGSVFVTNGTLVPALSAQKEDGGSGPDTFGETSSESSSSPSSPQHRGPQNLDSEDDINKDTDSHSDDSCKDPGSEMFFANETHPALMGDMSSLHSLSSNNHPTQIESICPESTTDFPALSFMHSLPYMLPNGTPDSQFLLAPPPIPNTIPDGKHSAGMQMPLVPPAISSSVILGEPEKRDLLPAFGIPPLGLHPVGSIAVQPLVQRFKTSLSHSQGVSDGSSGSSSTPTVPQVPQQAAIRAMSVMTPSAASIPPPLQQSVNCQDSTIITGGCTTLPPVEATHTKHPVLPSALPSAFNLPSAPTLAVPTVAAATAATGAAPSTAHIQAALPPAVPTHTPGLAPSPSPALTHSTARSDCTSYSNSGPSCGGGPVMSGNFVSFQQTQKQVAPQQQTPQQQQPVGCGACGCHNNCGRRGSGGGGGSGNSSSGGGANTAQTPLIFPTHQMAATARQVFSVPQPLFQLTNLCSNSYLTQGQPPHQANAAATLPPFFTAPQAPAHPTPYGPLHTHSHSHTDMLSTQATVVAVAAANFNLRQQMAPVASFSQRVYQHMYPNPLAMLSAAALGGGGVNKKSGNISCYNCGISGHYAQDCNQPSIDSKQQGVFRLKYAASHISEAYDNTD